MAYDLGIPTALSRDHDNVYWLAFLSPVSSQLLSFFLPERFCVWYLTVSIFYGFYYHYPQSGS